MLQQGFADPAVLILGIDVQVIDKFVMHCQKCHGQIIHLSHPDGIPRQNMLAKKVAVFIEEVTFGTLEFREGFFPGNSPQNRDRIEILRLILTNYKVPHNHCNSGFDFHPANAWEEFGGL
jgi:hypothetical protein